MYLWIKLAHLIFVIAFLGNITTGLFWHAHAARSKDARLLAFTMDGIIRSDRLFTLPGVVGIIVFGLLGAVVGDHPILGTGWILWTLILFSISGIAFMARVAPLQRKLKGMAEAGAATGTFDYAAYHATAKVWEAWGALALLTPVAGLFLMVLKPAL